MQHRKLGYKRVIYLGSLWHKCFYYSFPRSRSSLKLFADKNIRIIGGLIQNEKIRN